MLQTAYSFTDRFETENRIIIEEALRNRSYLLFFVLLLSGYRLVAQSGSIRIDHEQRSLVAVLEIIARQSRYHVIYSNDVVVDSMAVSVAAEIGRAHV